MQRLYDSNMQLIGYIKNGEDGKQTVYDFNRQILGYYYPVSDKTYDSNRVLVGKGNLLTSLLSKK